MRGGPNLTRAFVVARGRIKRALLPTVAGRVRPCALWPPAAWMASHGFNATWSRHNIMLLRNHGTLTVGRSVAEAFLRMYLLERACTMQVRTFALGGTPHPTAPTVIEKNAALAQGGGMSTIADKLVCPALLRRLDRVDPSFRN